VDHRTKTSLYRLAVIANDFQIPFHDERALLLFKMFVRRERPDWLILNGDFQDFWEISRYDQTPRTGKDFKQEIEIGKRILRSFRRSLPHSRITWIEGNHEFRLRKYSIRNAREFYGLPGLPVKEIAERFIARHSEDFERKVTPHWVGYLIRRKLGLKTYRRGGAYYVAESEKGKLDRLFVSFRQACLTRPGECW
jgi:hypothetical protein